MVREINFSLLRVDCGKHLGNAQGQTSVVNHFSQSSLSKEDSSGCCASIWNSLKSLWNRILSFFGCCGTENRVSREEIKDLLTTYISEIYVQLFDKDGGERDENSIVGILIAPSMPIYLHPYAANVDKILESALDQLDLIYANVGEIQTSGFKMCIIGENENKLHCFFYSQKEWNSKEDGLEARSFFNTDPAILDYLNNFASELKLLTKKNGAFHIPE